MEGRSAFNLWTHKVTQSKEYSPWLTDIHWWMLTLDHSTHSMYSTGSSYMDSDSPLAEKITKPPPLNYLWKEGQNLNLSCQYCISLDGFTHFLRWMLILPNCFSSLSNISWVTCHVSPVSGLLWDCHEYCVSKVSSEQLCSDTAPSSVFSGLSRSQDIAHREYLVKKEWIHCT